ncbi:MULTISPECIES: hypothetical protein [unclassified Streptomyces]|uniref:hypothetical protein n=1 Tax=unclassified Streptomyces TaxID=2593676 RepID=UPI00324BFD50
MNDTMQAISRDELGRPEVLKFVTVRRNRTNPEGTPGARMYYRQSASLRLLISGGTPAARGP